MTKSARIYIWMSHVLHMNESCHTYEWVMSYLLNTLHWNTWRNQHTSVEIHYIIYTYIALSHQINIYIYVAFFLKIYIYIYTHGIFPKKKNAKAFSHKKVKPGVTFFMKIVTHKGGKRSQKNSQWSTEKRHFHFPIKMNTMVPGVTFLWEQKRFQWNFPIKKSAKDVLP